MTRVVLYSKPGCHLCEIVEQTIRFVQRKRAFDFAKIDITTDAGLFEKYQYEIPVIEVNGAEVARHQLTAAALERALDEAGG